MIVAGWNVKLLPQTYGHPHRKHLATRMLSFVTLKDVLQKLVMVLDPPIPTTSAAGGQNAEDVHLQLNYQSHLPKKNGGARKSRSDVQQRTVLVIIKQAGKVGVMMTAKMTRGTIDGTVLPVRHSLDRQRVRAWNRLPHALRKSRMTMNGLKNPAPVSSWDPLPFRQRPLLQLLRALLQ